MTNNTSDVSTSWQLASFKDFSYLDSNLSGLRFSQGLVWNADAKEWISSWQYGLARLDSNFDFLQTTGTVDITNLDITTGIPQVLADMGFDHIGDIDYHKGKLYISLDSEAGDYQNGHVAVFRAKDLSYTGKIYELVGDPSNEHNDVASWVAVDGKNGLGYGKEWQSGDTINIYNLNDWSFKGTLEMDQSLKNIQGAKVYGGKLYMAADNSTRSIYSVDLKTGHVEELFQLPDTDGADTEMEGIEIRKKANGDLVITVELIVDPDGDIYADTYTRVFNYTLKQTGTVDELSQAHTWTVTSADDSSNSNDMALTLREAIAKAAAGDTITFDAALSGQTITLDDAELLLSKNITIKGDIDGDGKADITIDGGALANAIHVGGGNVTLDGLVVLHDDDTGENAIAVDDGSTVTLTNGATMALGSKAADTMDGTSHWDAIRGGAGNDTISGLEGDDLLYGEKGNDTIQGGDGNDSIYGGAGQDELWGGADADHFVFATGDSSAQAAKADTIMDFDGSEGDIIDLSAIDANSRKSGDQAFDFIGGKQFDGHAGELRFEKSHGDIYVYGDTNGDRKADFTLHFEDLASLKADYFVL